MVDTVDFGDTSTIQTRGKAAKKAAKKAQQAKWLDSGDEGGAKDGNDGEGDGGNAGGDGGSGAGGKHKSIRTRDDTSVNQRKRGARIREGQVTAGNGEIRIIDAHAGQYPCRINFKASGTRGGFKRVDQHLPASALIMDGTNIE